MLISEQLRVAKIQEGQIIFRKNPNNFLKLFAIKCRTV